MIKIGVIGAGQLGSIHIKLLKALADFELVGFYETDGAKSRAMKQEYEVEPFERAEELAEACDALVIASPTKTHADYALQFIRQFKHVFIEKPVTADPDDAKRLMKLVKEAEVVAQVGHVERFNPAYLAAVDYGLKPKLIDVQRLIPWSEKGEDVSVVYDLMIHDIDLVLKTVDANVKRISANGVSVVGSDPDIANARIEFHNGCVVNLTASRVAMANRREMRVYQRDAYITIDFLAQQTEIVQVSDETPKTGGQALEVGGQTRFLAPHQPEIQQLDPVEAELKAFAKAIKDKDEPPVTIHEAHLAMETAQKIMSAIETPSV